MNSLKLKRMLLLGICAVIILEIIDLYSVTNAGNHFIRDLQFGGGALVEYESELLALQQEIEQKGFVPESNETVMDEASVKFNLFVNQQRNEWIAVLKEDPSIVYYIDEKGIVFYDKLEYLLRKDIHLMQRSYFRDWVESK